MPNPSAKIPSSSMPRARLPKITLPKTKLPSPKSSLGEGDWERITPATQAKVWKKRFGFRSTGTCVCCHQTPIRRDDFVCGHRRAYASGGGNDVGNLEPICGRCSTLLGTHDLVTWCRKFQEELRAVKTMPKTTTSKKPVRKTTAKKSASKTAAAKKTVRKPIARKPASKTATVKKTVRKTTAKKPSAKKTKR
jgi:hypothetical protein